MMFKLSIPRVVRRTALTLSALALGTAAGLVTVAGGHVSLLRGLSVFKDVKSVGELTTFLDDIKGYLLAIVLAGAAVAGVAVAAAKFAGHTRANDMIFNVGIGIAILAAIPTMVG